MWVLKLHLRFTTDGLIINTINRVRTVMFVKEQCIYISGFKTIEYRPKNSAGNRRGMEMKSFTNVIIATAVGNEYIYHEVSIPKGKDWLLEALQKHHGEWITANLFVGSRAHDGRYYTKLYILDIV